MLRTAVVPLAKFAVNHLSISFERQGTVSFAPRALGTTGRMLNFSIPAGA